LFSPFDFLDTHNSEFKINVNSKIVSIINFLGLCFLLINSFFYLYVIYIHIFNKMSSRNIKKTRDFSRVFHMNI
jgi:hypothetical protein